MYGTGLGFLYENLILCSILRSVRGLHDIPNSLWISSGMVPDCQDPAWNPHPTGPRPSSSEGHHRDGSSSRVRRPGAFLSDRSSGPRSTARASQPRMVVLGLRISTDMSVIAMPRLLWYAASSISLSLQAPKVSILSSRHPGRMAGRYAPPFGILIR